MKQWISALGIGVIIVAGGGGYYIAHQRAESALEMITSHIQKDLGQNGSFKYESSSTSIWSQSATLKNVEIVTKDKSKVHFDSLEVKPNGKNAIANIVGKNFHYDHVITSDKVDIALITLRDITMAPDAMQKNEDGRWMLVPYKFTIKDGDLKDITVSDDSGDLKIAEKHISNYGLGKLTDIIIKNIQLNYKYPDYLADQKEKSGFTINQITLKHIGFADFFRDFEEHKLNFRNYVEKSTNQSTAIILDNLQVIGKSNLVEHLKQAYINLTPHNKSDYKIKTHVGNLVFNIQGFAKEITDKMGYKNGDFTFDQDLAILGDGNKLDNNKTEIVLKDMFNVQSTSQIINIPWDKIQTFINVVTDPTQSSDTQREWMGNIFNFYNNDSKVVSNSVTFQDQGLLNKLFAAKAKDEGKSVEQVKDEAIEAFKKSIDVEKPRIALLDQQSEQITQAVSDVIRDPSKPLIIKVNPKQPISLKDYFDYVLSMDPYESPSRKQELLDQVQFTIQAGAAHH